MLTSDKRQHIDAARQVLVGVVPNPTSQIDQITNALIYKFMDDMDQAAIKSGDEPSFFIGDLERYAWSRLMDPRLGNQEKMNLYGEALIKFSESKQLPQLFRDIFRQAYLPYRQPEVLGLFLHEINFFDYSHPEELGNAYEYLLSIMSSQGDAGQFRTPRHIIDFIVEVVDPSKDDRVLDPACGTGGFLVSAYKHIASKHDGKNIDGTPNGEKPLTPDDRRKLMQNFEGYDVDPGMVRIAQVNMYLHQFKNPKIYNYNTLSSEERWNDKFDVMLANPPFMSPKGGVQPHNKFSVQSSRSEVLFVDYIMQHLRPKGRAGIIVPEGIIFQTGKAHQRLRELLVKDGLYAVASLPSGVFQPYSGVKTSILFFDNGFTQKSKKILFVDIKDIGYSLGATKTPMSSNDLIPAAKLIFKFRSDGDIKSSRLAFATEKSEIASQGYDLSLSKYRKRKEDPNGKTFLKLSEICNLTKGKSSSTKTEPGPYTLFLTAEESKTSAHFDFDGEGVCVPLISATGHGKAMIKRVHHVNGKFALANLLAFVEPKNKETLDSKYLYFCLEGAKDQMAKMMRGSANVSMKLEDLEKFEIPLVSLEEQRQIVDELENYHKILAGARQIVTSWKPIFYPDPEWHKAKLGDIADINGKTVDIVDSEKYNYIDISSVENGTGKITLGEPISGKDLPSRARRFIQIGDVLLSTVRPNLNAHTYITSLPKNSVASTGFAVISPKDGNLGGWVYAALLSDLVQNQMLACMGKGVYPSINQADVQNIEIYCPPLKIQKEIEKEIEMEKILVESNTSLAKLYEQKINIVMEKLWGE